MRIIVLLLLVTVYVNAFSQTAAEYKKEMDNWHKGRREFLLSPAGWVNLEGLFWLKPGKNSFGSGKENDIVYNHPSFPKTAGYFLWEGNRISWTTAPGVPVTIKDSPVTQMVLFEEGSPAPQLWLGNFRWNIIKREDKIGVRFRDIRSAHVQHFAPIEHFPVSMEWRVNAHLETTPQPSILITNILGQTKPEETPGKLVFTLKGKTYRLDALKEGEELFIIFGDATSGKTTYPAGRFLYTPLPDANGNLILDFNKAFNPPCAFSVYATCPLPPKQNILPIAITAGEKEYKQTVK